MSSKDWEKVKLNEIIESVSIKHKFEKSEIILINTSDVLEGKVLNHDYVANKNLKGQFKKSFQKNDILYSEIRPKNKRFAYVDFNAEDYVASTKLMVLRKKSEMINTKYLYYLLTNDTFVKHLQNLAETRSGTFPQITFSELGSYIVSLPTLKEQEIIANILSTLDEKIEVNNKINETLENMAQALFKQWFVDFEFPNENGEPYKSSGGEMVESEIGLIPETWEIGNLSKFVDNIIGGDWGKNTPQKSYKEKVYCIRGADINELNKGNSGKVPIRFILEKNLNKKELQDGNLIVEISGGSPTQSTGRIGYVSKELLDRFDAPVVCTNFCRSIKLRNDMYQEFFYYFWRFLYDQKIFFNFENGTTGIKNLDLSSLLNNYNVVIPELHYIKKFSIIAKEINKNIKVTGLQNKKLREIRDTLLPKLMSGEIRVPLDELEESVT